MNTICFFREFLNFFRKTPIIVVSRKKSLFCLRCIAGEFIVSGAEKQHFSGISHNPKREGNMDKQTFVLSIVKHYICNRITELKSPEEEVFDEKFKNSLHHIACKSCKVYDRITSHVRVHDKSPDGECHMNCPG